MSTGAQNQPDSKVESPSADVEGRVDGERYDLYFGSRKVGTVTLTDSDFPNLWGTLACEPWLSAPRSPEEQRFSRFVELNKESTRLLFAEDEVDNSREQVVNAELEAEYMDLVESDDWRLVDRGGRELPILCPILRDDGEMVWRWNPQSKEQGRPMPIAVESRRKKLASVERLWPGAAIIDLTSKGPQPWVRFSPFYPHGGIPIPNTPDQTAQSVEGLWQGLKVFEREDIDPSKWAITDMAGIKRGGKSRGAVRGHRFGVGSDVLLGYREARLRIYLPAYQWVLENRLTAQVEELRRVAAHKPLVLLDFETNTDPEELSRPLLHAALVRYYLEGSWPQPARADRER